MEIDSRILLHNRTPVLIQWTSQLVSGFYFVWAYFCKHQERKKNEADLRPLHFETAFSFHFWQKAHSN